MKLPKLVAAFIARRFAGTRDKRLQVRLYDEEHAAYNLASEIEGDVDASAWARRKLNGAARETIEGAR